MGLKLYAEHDAGERIFIGKFHSLTAAANKVAQMDDDEEWPEGSDAIAEDDEGTEYMLVDDNWDLVEYGPPRSS